jgi:hypothetical protein
MTHHIYKNWIFSKIKIRKMIKKLRNKLIIHFINKVRSIMNLQLLQINK